MKKICFNGLLVLCSLAVCFILIETGLAVFSPHKMRFRPYHSRYDPGIGWINEPLKDEDVHFEFARNRFFHVRHNSLGLRGRETTYDKPPGTKRILFAGDSFFWGYGVSNAEVLTEVIQKNLPPSVEVLNGGTSGYGTDQNFLWLQREGLKFHPDIVIFGFTAANDLAEISSTVSYNYPKPIFMLEGGNLALKNVPVPRSVQTDRKSFGTPRTSFGKIKKFLRFHTHTYPFIMNRLNSRPDWRLFFINIGLAEEYTTRLGDIPVMTNPPGEALGMAFRLILESKKCAEEAGAEFMLVFIPDKEEDRSGKIRVENVAEGVYENNSRLSAFFTDFAAKEGIPFLDLLPVTRERYRNGEAMHNPDRTDHHWTALGHRVVAAEVRKFLMKSGWL